MNVLRTNTHAIATQNMWRMHNAQSTTAMTQIATGSRLSVSGTNSSDYIQASKNTAELRSLEMATRNINDAISLINTIDTTATNIQNGLMDMRAVAVSESDLLQDNYTGDKGRICDFFQQTLEGIIDLASNHSWNGTNFMIGGGQNNHTTTALDFSINVGGTDSGDDFQMTFKSFHPHSTVDRNGSFYGNPAAPNLPDLNKSAGTDTHVYGDAALYHGNGAGAPYTEGHLHGDNRDAISHTIIQLDRALEGITTERARLSSYLNRLHHMAENTMSEVLHVKNRKSQIEDTDFALQVAEFSKREILKQTSMAMLTQLNRRGTSLLQLLQ